MDASKEDREIIVDCLKKGRLTIGPEIKDAVERLFSKKPDEEFDWTITKYTLKCWGPYSHTYPDNGEKIGNDGGFTIDWQSESAGAGSVIFYIDTETKKICCQSECTSKRFVKELLCRIVDDIDWSDNVW